jgi:hypothetical protein
MSSFLGSEWLLRLRLWVQQKSLLRSRTSIPVVLPYVMPVVTIALFCAQMKMFSVAVTAKGNERALEDVGRYTSLHLAPALFCLFQFSLDRYLDQWANARPDYLESGQRPLLASYRPLLEQHPVASFSGAVGLLCLCLSAVALPFWYYLYSTLHFETAETANYSVGAYKLLALFLSAFFVCQMAEKTADIRVPSIPCERSLNVNRPYSWGLHLSMRRCVQGFDLLVARFHGAKIRCQTGGGVWHQRSTDPRGLWLSSCFNG